MARLALPGLCGYGLRPRDRTGSARTPDGTAKRMKAPTPTGASSGPGRRAGSSALTRMAWFGGLWLASVCAVGAVGYAIRYFLKA